MSAIKTLPEEFRTTPLSWVEAFTIFQKYYNGDFKVYAEDGTIYVDVPPEGIEDHRDVTRLHLLGWSYEEDNLLWYREVPMPGQHRDAS